MISSTDVKIFIFSRIKVTNDLDEAEGVFKSVIEIKSVTLEDVGRAQVVAKNKLAEVTSPTSRLSSKIGLRD